MFKRLKTGLSLEECKEVIKKNRWKFKNYFSPGKKNFLKNYGNFIYSGIIEGRNSWTIFFFGFLSRRDSTTEIRGFFFIHPYTIIITALIILFFIKLNTIMQFDNVTLPFIIAFLVMTVIALMSARKHPAMTIDYLKKILNAEEL